MPRLAPSAIAGCRVRPISMSPDPSPQADDARRRGAGSRAGWRGSKRGDTEALRALIEAHQHRIIGTVAKMLGDDSDAEDIAQQVFIRVWKSAGALRADREVHDLALQDHAQPRLQRTAPPQTPPDAFARCHATRTTTARMQMPDPQRRRPPIPRCSTTRCRPPSSSAIDELPETQRMAIILRRYDDISVRGNRRDPRPLRAGGEERPLPRPHRAAGKAEALSRRVVAQASSRWLSAGPSPAKGAFS